LLWKSGELARKASVSRQVVHEYTVLGLILPARTTLGGHRLYDEAALRRLRLVRDLVASGYTLRDIRATFFSRDPR
jgi:DNA-binding transcriptional MerR regulator